MTVVPNIPLNDGRSLPQLGFGTWRISSAAAPAAVGAALEIGYRHVDTAAAYANEEGVGRGLRESGVPREDLFVVTKLWNDAHAPDAARRAFDASLRRLGLDYVDLYLIHWPVAGSDGYVDAWKALLAFRREGRARSVGVSNFTPDQLERLVGETGQAPAVNQIELHPEMQQPLARACHERLGIVTESWSPLGRGAPLENPVLRRLAEKYGKTPAQTTIRWHLDSGRVVIPKSSRPERLRENFAVFDFALSAGDIAAVAALDRGRRIGPDPETFA